jgi:predicted Rdx family selenoprotein
VRPDSRRSCFRHSGPTSERCARAGIGDVFEITYDGETIWGRKADGGFPDVKTLKRPVRDRLDPSRDLGHIDRDRADEEGK